MIKNFNPKGFTLIELMVAITIIGILITISATAYQGANRSSRDAERKSDLEDIRSALEIYRSDCSTYPADGSVAPESPLTGNCAGSVNTYMSKVPQDPLYGSRGYIYKYQLTSSTYRLCAYLENGSGAVASCGTCGGNPDIVNCNYSVANP